MNATAKSRRGFTLTEIAIVLSVIGVIIGAIFYAASSAETRTLVNQAGDELNQISFNIRSLYAGRVSTFTVLNAVRTINATPSAADFSYYSPIFKNSGVFPAEMVTGANVNNPWNGNFPLSTVLASLAGSAGNPVQYVIRYTQLSPEVCTELVTKDSLPRDTGLVKIVVTGASTTTLTAAAGTLPATSVNAANACNNPGATNTINWYYQLGN